MVKKNNTKFDIFNFAAFSIWPFVAFIRSIIEFKERKSKFNFIFFIGFFGITIGLSTQNSDSDIYRYIEYFQSCIGMDFRTFSSSLYVSGGQVDVFFPITAYSVAQVTSSPTHFLLVLGLLFGIFYQKAVWMIFENISENIGSYTWILIFVFMLIFPFWRGINGFRFALASMVYFLGVNLSLQKRIAGGTLLLFSVLVHFSLMIPVLLFGFFLLNNKYGLNDTILFVLFLASFFIREIDLDALRSNLNIAPSFLDERVNNYVNSDYKKDTEELVKVTNFYARFFTIAINYSSGLFLTILYLQRKNIISPFKLSVLSFTLIFMIYSNLVSNIPSGSRFITLGHLFVFFLFIINYNYYGKLLLDGPLKVLITYLLLFYSIVQIRIGFDYLSFNSLFGNFATVYLFDKNVPIIDFLK